MNYSLQCKALEPSRLGARCLHSGSRRFNKPLQRRAVRADVLAAAGVVPASAGHPQRRGTAAGFACSHAASTWSYALGSTIAAAPALTSRLRPRPRQRKAAICAAAEAAAAASSAASVAAVAVGWLVIAGSCIRSLPQILRILKNKSVRGLSLTSFSTELFCYFITVAYNLSHGYAFSTYGDVDSSFAGAFWSLLVRIILDGVISFALICHAAICALQNVAILALIFQLGSVKRGTQAALTAGLAASAWWLLSGRCPPALLTALQAGSVALLALGGRLPQILLNLRRGNSGELSLLTCALSLTGNLMRVFTTLTLVGDPIILGSAATQAVLNGILTWQTIDTARRLRGAAATPAPQAA